ncbi:MAG: class I SAM-dependent methyltransferase [Candidatus Paceibacterota bacterium]|jgi:SAM-dependent methyltransferase
MIYDFLENKGVLINPAEKKLVDVGSGDGKNGAEFESHGWGVAYIEKKNGLDATTYDFPQEEFGLAIARNSLPFMEEKQLDVISKIFNTLKKGGYFYGTIFGKEDPWAKEGIITALDFDDVRNYLKQIGFKIVWEGEEKGIGKSMKGDLKNWHIFKFLCQK